MITAIHIENFKGIRDRVKIDLKPITLLFGPNSAGKSTIVQAIHYAREVLERQNLDPDQTLMGGDRVDLGGFQNLVHNHDLNREVCLRLEYDIQPHQVQSMFGSPASTAFLWKARLTSRTSSN